MARSAQDPRRRLWLGADGPESRTRIFTDRIRLGRATSIDLTTWNDQGKLIVKGKGRDPNILLWGNTYYLLRRAGNGISLVTSTDFIHWTDPVIIYKPEKESYQTESPFLVHYEGLFYLFWTLWDTVDRTTSGYCPWTYVHCSESPSDFRGKPVLAEFTVHAPEIIQDEGGQWFMSTADHPHRGDQRSAAGLGVTFLAPTHSRNPYQEDTTMKRLWVLSVLTFAWLAWTECRFRRGWARRTFHGPHDPATRRAGGHLGNGGRFRTGDHRVRRTEEDDAG